MALNIIKPGSKPPSGTVVEAPTTSDEQDSMEPEVIIIKNKVAEKKIVAPEPKKSELAALIAAIKKDKGDKVLYLGREVPDVKRLPTGDFEFDFNTGGGFPRGRISLIYGPESSCKTTIALRAAAVAQRGPEECNKAVFIDVEHSFDAQRAEEVGVNIDQLIVVKSGFGEEASDLTVALIGADDVAIVIVDSLAALISTAEIDKSAEKFDVGTSAILIKRMTNKINNQLAQEAKRDHIPAVILINQIRYKVGVVFGNPETTPGGKNPHFLSALTVRVSGKNVIVGAVNPDKPSIKEIDCQIIKAKVGIIRSNFKMSMAMIAHGDLLAGETKSYGMVEGELKAAGLLKKPQKGTGWILEGKLYPILSIIEDTYYADVDFMLHLQKMVIDSYQGKKTVFDDTKKFLAGSETMDVDETPEEGSQATGMMFQGKS